MNIILTIKAILNYLYSHLIDLINVKKIVFQDGTEQTTAGGNGGTFSLFDIKFMAQAIADKGWAFMCHTTRQDLAKADVPTIYNNIKNKYDNCDFGETALTIGSDLKSGEAVDEYHNLSFSTIYAGICTWGNRVYAILSGTNDSYLYYSDTYQAGATWLRVSDVAGITTLFKANNCIIVTTYNAIYKLNPTTNTLTLLIDNAFGSNGNGNGYFNNIQYKLIDNYIYLTYVPQTTEVSNYYKRVYYVLDDASSTTSGYLGNFNEIINDIIYVNNRFYYLTRSDDRKYVRVYKTTEDNQFSGVPFNNTACFTKVFEKQHTDVSISDDWENNAQIFYHNGRFVITAKLYSAHLGFSVFYTDDDFTTVNYVGDCIHSYSGNQVIKCINGVLYSIEKYMSATLTYLYYCNIENIQLNNWQYLSNLTTVIDNNGALYDFDITENLNLFCLNKYNTQPHIYYNGFTKTVYTDNYNINGITVSVNYYKFNDFKICISDGGTNDTNLETIFNYLGYCNYWLLDLTNETITIQRNKQGYVQMYIGDDFVDDLDYLPTISTRPLPQAEEIVDSSASASLDVLPNKDYKLTNVNLSSLTLNSCQDSPLGTTIRFNSGATPTTITDNTNIDWVDGATPIPSASVKCLIFIWNNIGFYKEW